jgi:hypothetical protein
MRQFIIAGMAIAMLAIPAVASADVPRYQEQTATFTATQPANEVSDFSDAFTHQYKVAVNPCDGTFFGIIADISRNGTPTGLSETVTGSFTKTTVTLVSKVDSTTGFLTDAPFDGVTKTNATTSPAVPYAIPMTVKAPEFTNTSNYKNHGQYVSSQGGGSDAAHSCIGMPIK